MILAGDIGGTKTNLALFSTEDGILTKKAQQQFASADYTRFDAVIDAFMQDRDKETLQAACFGIAGPIIEGSCKTTNLPWDISTKDLQKQLGIEKVRLLNDLEATAYGMINLSEEAFVALNQDAKKVEGNCAVIAAGTGLGEAILYHDSGAYHPIGTEGGHTDFAPLTPQQDALLYWLRERYPEHVSIERILSGPGIYSLYSFLKENGFAPECETMQTLKEGEDKSAMVSHCALHENDPLSQETLRLFVEIYGAEAGNLALKSFSLGGIYIGGGIAPKILPFLEEGTFMENFVAKGRFKAMLQAMPVHISLDDETALLGAAHYANDRV